LAAATSRQFTLGGCDTVRHVDGPVLSGPF
jgi:hypothetical protein